MTQSPYRLLEMDPAAPRLALAVVGCGNLLRGDDAAGSVLVRRLWEAGGLGDHVRLSDAGTAGMNVAFELRYANRVILVDAANTGAAPGTVYQVPAAKLANLPPPGAGMGHDFRWDHAVAFGRWLLGPLMPADVQVYLIEGAGFAPGAHLTQPVSRAVDQVAQRIRRLAIELAPEEVTDLVSAQDQAANLAPDQAADLATDRAPAAQDQSDKEST